MFFGIPYKRVRFVDLFHPHLFTRLSPSSLFLLFPSIFHSIVVAVEVNFTTKVTDIYYGSDLLD